MEEERNNKKRSGGTGPYLLLMIGILGALVALFFTVRAVSIRINEKRDAARENQRHIVATSSGVTTVEEASPSDADQAGASEAVPQDGQASGSVERDAEESGPAIPEGDQNGEAAGSLAESFLESAAEAVEDVPGGPLLKNEVPAASAIAAKYFDAVTAQDEAALEEIMDVVPDQLKELIKREHKVYSDVEVYTKEGPDSLSYIVIATYKSVTDDSGTALPNYKQWLIRQNDQGTWQIIRSEPDAVTQSWIDAVMSEDDVTALTESIKKDREAAVAAQKAAQAAAEDTASSRTDTAPESVSESGGTQEESTPSGHVISNVNLRAGGGFEYEVIGTLPAGAEVRLLGGDSGGWLHVEYDGMEGYAGHSYIKVD